MRRRTVEIEPQAKPSAAPELDTGALSVAERAVTDRRMLVSLLVTHAARIAESKRLDAMDRALHKATRAHLVAQELGDQGLLVEALRVRLAIAQRAPGRHELAAKLACELVALLETSPDDTRRERALLLAGALSKPWWWYAETRAPKRAEVADDEAQLRKALALLLENGDEVADDVAFVAAQLLQLLERCHALEAATALRVDLRAASSAVSEACALRDLKL